MGEIPPEAIAISLRRDCQCGPGAWTTTPTAMLCATRRRGTRPRYLADYDAQNRLVTYSRGANRETVLARFVYDGDGKRARRVGYVNATQTFGVNYVGSHYSKTFPGGIENRY